MGVPSPESSLDLIAGGVIGLIGLSLLLLSLVGAARRAMGGHTVASGGGMLTAVRDLRRTAIALLTSLWLATTIVGAALLAAGVWIMVS